MKTTVQLESKDVRTIIARFLGISEEQVIPMRYNFAIEGMTAEQTSRKWHLNVRITENRR